MRASILVVASLFVVVVGVRRSCGPTPAGALRAVTFNVRDFPESDRQVRGAFALVRELAPSLVGLQEITDPVALQRATREHLGPGWRAFVDDANRTHRVALLVDTRRHELRSIRTRRETMLGGAGKAALEVRVEQRGRGLRVFVVHLKAGGSDGDAGVRAAQLEALAPLVVAARRAGDDALVLGDFNATGDADRAALARFARATGLAWATEPLACTSYWDRSDGCRGTALDHVFASSNIRDVAARGPCETIGCDPGPRCPAFHRDVSDHCPVAATLAP